MGNRLLDDGHGIVVRNNQIVEIGPCVRNESRDLGGVVLPWPPFPVELRGSGEVDVLIGNKADAAGEDYSGRYRAATILVEQHVTDESGMVIPEMNRGEFYLFEAFRSRVDPHGVDTSTESRHLRGPLRLGSERRFHQVPT